MTARFAVLRPQANSFEWEKSGAMMIAKLNVLRRWPSLAVLLCVTAAAVTTIAAVKHASAEDDSVAVRSLDAAYQAAVKTNDVATMERLLADDFVLVTGRGQTFTKTDLLNEARGESIRYEKQDDSDQTVRLWGDTAVITAKLWMKGMEEGRPFDKRVWFSDTYVRTPAGWKYVFGQSSLPLPN